MLHEKYVQTASGHHYLSLDRAILGTVRKKILPNPKRFETHFFGRLEERSAERRPLLVNVRTLSYYFQVY